MTHTSPAINQTGFRARENSGNEATPTWIAAVDTNWTQDVDTSFRVRFELTEANGSNEAISPEIWYNLSGTWAAVTASTPIQFATLTGTTDATATTQQLGGGGTFVAGEVTQDATWSSPSLNSEITELEVCLTIDSAQVVDTDTIGLRIYNGGLVLSGSYNQEPTITVNEAVAVNVEASTEALTLTEYQATITLDVDVSAATEALTLTGLQATIETAVNTEVPANAEALTLTAQAATISYDVEVTAGPEPLTLTPQAASVAVDVDIAANIESLTVTPLSAGVSVDTDIAVAVETLSLAPLPATIGVDVDVLASVEVLTLTEHQASVTVGSNTDVQANAEALTLTPQAATIGVDVDVLANAEALTITPSQAVIGVDVDVASGAAGLTLTAYPVTVDVSGSDITVAASVAPLVLVSHPATIGGATARRGGGYPFESSGKSKSFFYDKQAKEVEERLENALEQIEGIKTAPVKVRARAARKVLPDIPQAEPVRAAVRRYEQRRTDWAAVEAAARLALDEHEEIARRVRRERNNRAALLLLAA